MSRGLEQALQRAIELASEHNHEYATLEHLLLALVNDADAAQVMRACNVDLLALRASLIGHVGKELATPATGSGEEAKPTTGFQRVVQRAVMHVQNSGRDEVTGANVLVALFSERESRAVLFLQEHKMSRLDAVNYMSHGIAKRPGMRQPKSARGAHTTKQPEQTSPAIRVSEEAYLPALRRLIARLCDQWRLDALSRILPGYLALNPQTDGWANLYEALKSTRALGQEALTAEDWDVLNGLIREAERVIYLR